MRGVFFILLFANLAFFAWAQLIDRPAEPPLNSTISRLPRLQLLNETSAPGAQGAGASSAAAARAAAQSSAPAVSGPAGPGAGSDAGAGSGVGQPRPPTAGVSAGANAPPIAAAAQRCITVGPFLDDVRAEQASSLLKSRGFVPRMRTQPGAPVNRFWVFIAGFSAPADEAQALQVLQRNGIADAQPMTEAGTGRMISVGLFAERAGAERRAAAVRGLGMKPAISQRQEPQPENWIDVDLSSSIQSLPTEGLLSLQDSSERLEIKECPHLPA